MACSTESCGSGIIARSSVCRLATENPGRTSHSYCWAQQSTALELSAPIQTRLGDEPTRQNGQRQLMVTNAELDALNLIPPEFGLGVLIAALDEVAQGGRWGMVAEGVPSAAWLSAKVVCSAS